MITEKLSTLHIHQLSEDQYKRLVDEGKDDENALYLTPDKEVDTTLSIQGAAADAKAVGDALVAINEVPTCTTTDDGKFLRVINGVATWSSVTNGEEVSY